MRNQERHAGGRQCPGNYRAIRPPTRPKNFVPAWETAANCPALRLPEGLQKTVGYNSRQAAADVLKQLFQNNKNRK